MGHKCPDLRIKNRINLLGQIKIISTFNAHYVYWQIDIYETSLNKTPFVIDNVLYKYKGTPFGLNMRWSLFGQIWASSFLQ